VISALRVAETEQYLVWERWTARSRASRVTPGPEAMWVTVMRV